MRALPAALLLVACSGAEDPVDSDVLTACEGAGEGTLDLGTGGRSAFEPWADGEAVSIVDDPNTGWGLRIELLTTGLDTTAPSTSVIRILFEPGAPTTDFLGQVQLQCDEDEGIAWVAVQAPLPEPWQGYPGSLDGATIDIDATITDATGETASDAVSVVVAAG